MFSYLKGQPVFYGSNLTLLVNDSVGYAVSVSPKVAHRLANQPVAELFIYPHIREDAFELYGFMSVAERELFLQLIHVSGVGPKVGLAIMELDPEKIVAAVQVADVSVFSSVPRVGKKLAQKIIIELKSKLGSLQELSLGPRSPQEAEVIEALAALGFGDAQIEQSVRGIVWAEVAHLSTADVLKLALNASKKA